VPPHDRSRGLPGLGGLVRRHRQSAGISLRELARRLDVSASLLSRIERGMAQPSVTTLYGLASELDLSLDELTRTGAAPGPPGAARDDVVLRLHDRPSLPVAPGVRMELLSDPADPELEVLWTTYQAGAASGEDRSFVTHAGRETGVVLSGVLEVTLSDRVHRLAAGDAITFDSTTPHRFRSVGDEPVQAVWVNAGRNARTTGRFEPPESGAQEPRSD
jgi:transcriptional regulator with XRE-family HTH domain